MPPYTEVIQFHGASKPTGNRFTVKNHIHSVTEVKHEFSEVEEQNIATTFSAFLIFSQALTYQCFSLWIWQYL